MVFPGPPTEPPVTVIHVPPSWFVRANGYRAGWVRVTVCMACKMVGHEDDLRLHNPCPRCAGKLMEKIGRWNPIFTTKKRLFWTTKKETSGFWETK